MCMCYLSFYSLYQLRETTIIAGKVQQQNPTVKTNFLYLILLSLPILECSYLLNIKGPVDHHQEEA